MKRLLITGSTFPRWEGDSEPRFILDYAKAMSEYYDVTVMVPAFPGAKKREVLDGIKVIRYHYFPIHKFETLCYPGAIAARIKQKKIRIILVPFLFISLFFALIKVKKQTDFVHAHWLIPQGIVQSMLKKPYIVTGHGGDVTSLNKGFIKKLKKKCIEKAVAVTCVSKYLKSEIEKISPDTQVKVLSMGVDLSNFGRENRKENFFNQEDKKVVLFVGRLAEKKGVRYLIEAMNDIENAKLVIAGDGTLRQELEELAKTVNADIEFIGSVTHNQLKTIYASADVFVMPSVTGKDGDIEGLGLVMLEAMSSGLPVVASRSGGITDVIIDGENGLLCEEKNSRELSLKISQLLNDSDLNERIAKAGFETAQRYDYKEIAKAYKELIDKVGDND